MTLPTDDDPTARDYVHTLYSGVHPTPNALILDTATMDDLARQVREIEESRAVAAVTGRDYLIK
jgi:hypothetical protein